MKYIYTLLAVFLANPTFADPTLPDGYELQVLDPTGGKIARPIEWFYRERHSESSWRWILSKEHPDQGPYETGVSIQVFAGRAADSEWSAEQLARSSFESKKRESVEVLKECASSELEMFERICLEVIEESDLGKHRVLYSYLWGRNDVDIIAVSVAGTTPEQWERYGPVFNVMSAFELIDMNRFTE